MLLKKFKNSQTGYLLAEIIFAAALLVGIVSWMSLEFSSWQKLQKKSQVRTAAYALAAELRTLQRNALYLQDGYSYSMTIADNYSYSIYNGTSLIRKTKFKSIGCADVYFSSKVARVTFSSNGAPSTSGTYVLRHSDLSNFSYKLVLQAVTGRVSINEAT